jgi:hypothetical protein
MFVDPALTPHTLPPALTVAIPALAVVQVTPGLDVHKVHEPTHMFEVPVIGNGIHASLPKLVPAIPGAIPITPVKPEQKILPGAEVVRVGCT